MKSKPDYNSTGIQDDISEFKAQQDSGKLRKLILDLYLKKAEEIFEGEDMKSVTSIFYKYQDAYTKEQETIDDRKCMATGFIMASIVSCILFIIFREDIKVAIFTAMLAVCFLSVGITLFFYSRKSEDNFYDSQLAFKYYLVGYYLYSKKNKAEVSLMFNGGIRSVVFFEHMLIDKINKEFNWN